MADLNEALLIGHLGRDPEQRSFQNGGTIVSFSLATNRNWKDKTTGEPKSVTQWHNVVVLDELAQKLAMQYLKKGSRVLVRGTIETRKYTGRDGNERTITEIVVRPFGSSQLLLLSSKNGASAPATAVLEPPPKAGHRIIDLDDEIPF